MNKRIYLLMVVLVWGIFSGCNKQNSESSKYTLMPIEYNIENSVVLCLHNDCMIFYQDGPSMLFYKYDLKNDMTYLLGTIEKPSYQQFDNFAISENKLYFYLCTQSYLEAVDGKYEQSLYQIDLEKNALVKLTEDNVTREYLSLYAMENKVFTLKEQSDSNKCYTYIDFYDKIEEGNSDFQVLLSKEYDKTTGMGEEILDFCIDDEIIYLFVKESNNNKTTWKIEKYNMQGQAVGEVQLSNAIVMDMQKWTRQLRFEVIGNYVYLRNQKGSRFVLDISSGEAIISLLDEHLVLKASADIENRKFAIVYDDETEKAWEINNDTDTITEIDAFEECEYIKGMWSEGKDKLLVLFNQMLYKNF